MSAWWDDEHKLCLLTPEELAALPDGTELECIDGERVIKSKDELDNDTRFGHVPYGVTGDHPLRLALLEKMKS